eukprot:CAMPEP_0181300638 /NCGR_PEP_ID=MMETSP1101-20121128/6997_1 /TAXON_ID=46948 /ORGANISM="Rhodomonas abbreviata, Strain Caron Lab Isolate" /LENGTH=655 /DNA_ID=CAMNT_0023405889 /DNA_START=17 /DNA_END=1980 /DNA_ORIENTATION=+
MVKVCVIGSGVTGLVMVKELLESGHEPVCFEATGVIGGLFSYSYEGLYLTSSSHITAFSDFPPKCEPCIWKAGEYVDYLKDYCKEFDLMKHVHFNTKVISVQRMKEKPGASYWVVATETASGQQAHYFDYVVVSTGTNNVPKRWKYDGQDSFTGTVMHSGDINDFAPFDNKKTLCVGMGESGADIILHIAQREGASVAMSVRSSPGWITPRYRANMPADLMTNRIVWGLPRRLGAWLGWLISLSDIQQSDPVVRKAGEINLENKTTELGLFGTFGTKTTNGIEAMLNYGAEIKGDVRSVGPGKRVTFKDGSTMEGVDYVVQCTGFEPTFRILEGGCPQEGAIENDAVMQQVCKDVCNVRRGLYKHALHPSLGSRLLFAGFVRPGFGAIPPLAEMQARWYVAMLDGKAQRPLPSREEMLESIAADAAGEESMYRKGPGVRIASLVDYMVYMNDMATRIGCMPPWWRLLFSDPVTLWTIFTGPLSGTQFRLAGPGAKPSLARAILRNYPSFFPLKRLAVISAGLWVWSGLINLLLLPFPSSTPLLGPLKETFKPVGFSDSRYVYNSRARALPPPSSNSASNSAASSSAAAASSSSSSSAASSSSSSAAAAAAVMPVITHEYAAEAARERVEGEDPALQKRAQWAAHIASKASASASG